jgi:hypothetical protein
MNNLGFVAAEIESVITALSYREREAIIAEAAAEIGATAEAAPSARAIAAAPGGGDFRTAQVRPWRRFLDRFISHRGRGDHCCARGRGWLNRIVVAASRKRALEKP